ncbi:MAG: agl cluster protein AglQ, partial [bacterium]
MNEKNDYSSLYSMFEILKTVTDKEINNIFKKGYATPGHNGPYQDVETPVRNTAHYLLAYSNLYKYYEDDKYLKVINRSADYLMKSINRPNDATFYCRDKDNKDKSNGLMGQAWVIEALCGAYETLNEKKYLDLAEKVFLLHPFEHGFWKIVDTDGSVKKIDGTFNHQLWFAAAGTII